MLKVLNDKERDLIINIQLVDTINCDESYVKKELIVGSGPKTKLSAVRKAMGLDATPTTPSFGKLKASRV